MPDFSCTFAYSGFLFGYLSYPKPKTSNAEKRHKKYPYLLRGLKIARPNFVWCADITYVPMRQGFMYLVAVMDWSGAL